MNKVPFAIGITSHLQMTLLSCSFWAVVPPGAALRIYGTHRDSSRIKRVFITWPKAYEIYRWSHGVWRKHSSRDWHQLGTEEASELFIAVNIPAAVFGGIIWNSRLYKNYKVWQDFEALDRQRHLSSRQGCPRHLKALSAAPCIIINLVKLVLQWPNINQTKRCHTAAWMVPVLTIPPMAGGCMPTIK